jgi:hypothetical protein
MTTNVRDSQIGEFATDSRWSIDLRSEGVEAIIFIDDGNYNKIVVAPLRAYMFAGNSGVIDKWKTAINLVQVDPLSVDWALLPVNGMAISIVNLFDASIDFEYGHEIRLPDKKAADASFAGSGSISACNCWKINRNPRKAVESAKGSDLFTGGAVRFLEFETKNNNLVTDVSLAELQNAISDKGMIMDTTLGFNSQPTPIRDSLDKQANLSAALEKVRMGELSPTAPCDAVFNTWTDKQRQKLIEAMGKAYPKSAS